MTDFEFVTGTGGKPDYLVVTTSGRCVAAIKPDIGMVKNHPTLVVRVRVCAQPGLQTAASPMSATEIMQAFPNCPMPNVNASRGSLELRQVLPIVKHQDEIIPSFQSVTGNKKFLMEMVATLKKSLSITELDHDDAVLADWLESRWSRTIQQLGFKLNKSDPEAVKLAVTAHLAKLFGAKPE